MRVAHVNLAGEPGYDPEALVSRYHSLAGLTRAQAGEGADVRVLQRFSQDAWLHCDGVEFVFCRDGHNPLAPHRETPRRMWRALMERPPDIVHLHGLGFPVQARQLRRLIGPAVPLVVQDHVERAGPLSRRLLQRWGLRGVDAFLFTAAELGHALARAGVIRTSQPIVQVPEASSGFEPIPRAEARQVTGVDGDPAVLWVARLAPVKDPLTAIGGFIRAAPACRDARLFIVHQQDGLLEAARALIPGDGPGSQVRFLGPRPHPDLPAWYSAADLLVTSSRSEAGNFALVEALACGLLPVCSDIPVNRVLTGAGAWAEVFACGSVDGCAAALRRGAARAAAGGDGLRRQVRAYFEAHLSWPVVARKTLQLYGDLIAARPAGRTNRP